MFPATSRLTDRQVSQGGGYAMKNCIDGLLWRVTLVTKNGRVPRGWAEQNPDIDIESDPRSFPSSSHKLLLSGAIYDRLVGFYLRRMPNLETVDFFYDGESPSRVLFRNIAGKSSIQQLRLRELAIVPPFEY